MSQARGFFNQKLYYAATLIKALHRSLDAQREPEPVLLEAFGQGIQGHLRDAYGFFLLELGGVTELPPQPPADVAQLLQVYPQEAPLRGELVELQQLEGRRESWLWDLLNVAHHGVTATASTPVAPVAVLARSSDDAWTVADLELWCRELSEIGDRMGDSLDEW